MNIGLLLVLWIVKITAIVSGSVCDRTLLGHLGTGVISSYNFPFNYRHNLTCTYRIKLNASANARNTICFKFHRFALESSSPFCSFDYLKFNNIKYCGQGWWQYGVQNTHTSSVWSSHFCWTVKGSHFDVYFTSDDNINGAGFYATYRIYKGALSTPDASQSQTLIDICQPEEWTCFNRKCIPKNATCDGTNDCGDRSDESYIHARCGEQNVLGCDFSTQGGMSDGFCGFVHDNGPWYRTNNRHSQYGPQGDHTNTTTGYYVYTDSGKRTSYLRSPELALPPNRTYCLTFWYYMYGRPAATELKVYIHHRQHPNKPEWSRKATSENRWLQGQVLVKNRPKIQVIFGAHLGNSFSGVALDDISLLSGGCQGEDISCNFESSTCGWTMKKQMGSLKADLKWHIHGQTKSPVGPIHDHSSTGGGGQYLFLNTTSNPTDEHRALLASSAVSSAEGEKKCFQFWYYMAGFDQDCCVLRARTAGIDGTLKSAIWTKHGNVRNQWIQGSVEIDLAGAYQVVLEGVVLPRSMGEISLDEFIMMSGPCPSKTPSPCAEGKYLCANSKCIEGSAKCNSFDDCGDGSDEDLRAACPVPATTTVASKMSCDIDQYQCHNGHCIRNNWRCDNHIDCEDGSDEDTRAGCNKTNSGTSDCGVNYFQCRRDKNCLPLRQRCDGVNNCADASDESAEHAGCKVAVSTALSSQAIIGISFACLIVITIIIVNIVVCRYCKSKPARSREDSPRHRPMNTTVSTISFGDTLTRSPQTDSQLPFHPPPYTPCMDNFGYTVDRPGDNNVFYPPDEPPPPYDSIIKDEDEEETNPQIIQNTPTSGTSGESSNESPNTSSVSTSQEVPNQMVHSPSQPVSSPTRGPRQSPSSARSTPNIAHSPSQMRIPRQSPSSSRSSTNIAHSPTQMRNTMPRSSPNTIGRSPTNVAHSPTHSPSTMPRQRISSSPIPRQRPSTPPNPTQRSSTPPMPRQRPPTPTNSRQRPATPLTNPRQRPSTPPIPRQRPSTPTYGHHRPVPAHRSQSHNYVPRMGHAPQTPMHASQSSIHLPESPVRRVPTYVPGVYHTYAPLSQTQSPVHHPRARRQLPSSPVHAPQVPPQLPPRPPTLPRIRDNHHNYMNDERLYLRVPMDDDDDDEDSDYARPEDIFMFGRSSCV